MNVIGAPRETLVTNVGGFRIPNRLLKSLPYPVFRIAVVPRGLLRYRSRQGATWKDSPDTAFRSIPLYHSTTSIILKSVGAADQSFASDPPCWRFSCSFGEDPRKMALVGESAHKRYFGKRRICRQHQILGRLDAPPYQPAMWRDAGAASKRSGEVATGKPALAGNLLQRKLSFKISVDRISRKPQLPRRQPSTHQGSWEMHAAIVARENRKSARTSIERTQLKRCGFVCVTATSSARSP